MSRIAECHAKALGSRRSVWPRTHVHLSMRDMFQRRGHRRDLQPLHSMWAVCTTQDGKKWAILEISVENWQLYLFLHFHNFFTWHLLEGEYCWRSLFLKRVPKHEKIDHLSIYFPSETWIQVHRANAEDGFVMNKIIHPPPCTEGNHFNECLRAFDQGFVFKVFLL